MLGESSSNGRSLRKAEVQGLQKRGAQHVRIKGEGYLHCLLAHTHDEPSGDEEKSVLMMILDKCAHEFHAYMDECEATGATNCMTAAGTIAHLAFRSTRK
jgi:hypothetical protein